jgi:hypothetical protein
MPAPGAAAPEVSESATMEPAPRTPEMKTVPQPPMEKIFQLKNWEDFREAKELRDRIQAVQASYHLADPAQRVAAITEVIEQAVKGMVPEKRKRVLESLEELFPVLADAPQSLALRRELETLREENARLRDRLRALGEKKQSAPAPSFEKLLLAITGGSDAPGGLPEDERAAAQILRTVLTFAQDLERLITSLVQSFQTGGAELTRYVIPPFRKNLADLLEQAGPAPDAQTAAQLESYLAAVRGWLIASIMGYSRASGEYCRQLLNRIDPRRMEKQTELPRWRDAMGLADSDLWKRFKEVYADLQVDLVDDQIQEKAAALAGEEFRKLKQQPTGRNET